MDIVSLKEYFQAQKNEVEKQFSTLLSFKTVSADPNMHSEMISCAKWLKKQLQALGGHVEFWESKGPPVVFAAFTSSKKQAPTLLLYAHYDVQPVDPIEEWTSDPFTARKEGDTFFSRGASDDKGHIIYTLLTLKNLTESGLPCHIKIVFEGEEEIASGALTEFCQSKQEELRADYAMVLDLGMRVRDVPVIPMGTRGIAGLHIEVQGPNQDLHSGSHGGAAHNPLIALAHMLAALHDREGRVCVPGFYDDVSELTLEERNDFDLTYDETAWERIFGQKPTGGENKYPLGQRISIRPTLEINGICGGYTGPGIKTIIPKKANAIISCRLVPNQDPIKTANQVKNFLQNQAPEGITARIKILEGMGRAFRAKSASKLFRAIDHAMQAVWNVKPKKILEGGSVPILPLLHEACQGDLIGWGMGLSSDRIHSPDEHFDLRRMEQGFLILTLSIAFLNQSE